MGRTCGNGNPPLTTDKDIPPEKNTIIHGNATLLLQLSPTTSPTQHNVDAKQTTKPNKQKERERERERERKERERERNIARHTTTRTRTDAGQDYQG